VKNFTTTIITIVILACVLQLPLNAGATSPENDENRLPLLSLSDFLTEMEMSLELYIALVEELIKAGTYTYYLPENSTRYEAYQKENPHVPYEQILSFVNVGLDNGFYNNISEAPLLGEINILVNKTYNLPSLWEPEIMVPVSQGRTLHPEAAEQFDLMREAIIDSGLEIYVISAYRSRGRQARIFADEVELRGRTATERSVARAGHSEHQTGLVVDILHRSYGSLRYANFQDTELYAWLAQNAHEFGFILRYPDEYQEFHGYIFEPWHWRYVGVEIATAMYNYKIAFYEDFYGRYITSDVLHNARELIYEHRRQLEIAAASAAAAALALEEAERMTEDENRRASLPEQSRQMILDPSTGGNVISESLDSNEINPIHYRVYLSIFTLIVVYLISTLIFIIIPKIKKKRGA